jgi:7 transmembrane receptor (rhodopsin family).
MDLKFFLFMVVSPIGAALMIILNSIEIWFIFKHKLMSRVKSTVYILNLAISDICLGIFVIMVKICKAEEMNNGLHPKYRLFFQTKMVYVSLYVSVLSLAALTVERYLAVKKPMYYNMLEIHKKYIICVLMWLVTILATIVHNLTVNDFEKEYIKTPLVILISAILIAAVYVVILRTLKRRKSRSTALAEGVNQKKTMTKAEKRFLSFCIKSFIIFVVCWLPLAAYGIALAGGFITTWKYKDYFDFITHIIAFWNSNASPIMFLHHNRGAARKIAITRTTSNKTQQSDKEKSQSGEQSMAFGVSNDKNNIIESNA